LTLSYRGYLLQSAADYFDYALFISKLFTFVAMAPLTIHEILQMPDIVPICCDTLMTILGSGRSCHYFDSSSHSKQIRFETIQ
jgi:hypothetical protein